MQRLERVLEVRGVGDQVGLAVLAEHDLLRAAVPPEAEAEHQRQISAINASAAAASATTPGASENSDIRGEASP